MGDMRGCGVFPSGSSGDNAHMGKDGVPNGWNGTVVEGRDPYALKRDCNASSRIWLHDFARKRPTSMELHGFDISLDQVGPKPWVPANTNFHTWDIFGEPPSQFVGYFDVVHVRLITVVVKNNDPRPILSSLAKLLKPGGYLQWDEVDTIGCSIKTVPSTSAPSLEKITSQLKGNDTWKYDLTGIMEENGHSNPKLHTFEYGLDMARFWNDVYISTWKEFADHVLKMPEVTRKLEQDGLDEARRGAATMVPKLVWVAQKV
ncbi:hypothetical protein Daus18300_011933 [Diaporthe australafricana]|uniref:UMTA methyltransferase family protein n=1 Tax=Diaporthe australafricana TaxID=127596 RepID=A0ABR3W4Q9_9PEZI